MGVAVVAAILAVFSWGLASNYRYDPLSAPNFIVWLSMLAGVSSIALIVVGLVSR